MAKLSFIPQHHLFSRLGAFLLLLIFLSVPLIEALHHHASQHSTCVQKDYSKKELKASQVKCKLCDLIRHHSQHLYLIDQQTISFNTTLLQTLRWHFRMQASSDFILVCANKGPPALLL